MVISPSKSYVRSTVMECFNYKGGCDTHVARLARNNLFLITVIYNIVCFPVTSQNLISTKYPQNYVRYSNNIGIDNRSALTAMKGHNRTCGVT